MNKQTKGVQCLRRLLPFLAILLFACSDTPCEPGLENRDPILDAVFRFTYDQYVREWSDYEFATFAEAETWIWKMNSDEELRGIGMQLLQTLGDLPLPVRPYAECDVSMRIRHPDFEGRGILLWVGSITITSGSNVVVYAGYFGSELGAAGALLELQWTACRWSVVKYDPLWVS